MNKVIITMICIIVTIGAIFTAIAIFKTEMSNNNSKQNDPIQVAEEILDECTDEYEALENQNTLQTNSDQEKVSPECSFTIKTYYKSCGHTKNQYLELPQELVNANFEEVKEKYPDYTVEKFSSNEIVLYQEKEEECGEHYVVKEENGKVVVYVKQNDGTEKLFEETDISTDYLPETDKINMKRGIEVNGKQDLNKLIEDFE